MIGGIPPKEWCFKFVRWRKSSGVRINRVWVCSRRPGTYTSASATNLSANSSLRVDQDPSDSVSGAMV